MKDDISSILSAMADMNKFGADDRLSAIADSFDEGELFEDDLDQVFAAYSPMKYSDFMKKVYDAGKGPDGRKR